MPASFSCFVSCVIYNFVFQAISEKKREKKGFTVKFLKIVSCYIPHSKFVLLVLKTTFLLARISCCNFFFFKSFGQLFGAGGHTCLAIKELF